MSTVPLACTASVLRGSGVCVDGVGGRGSSASMSSICLSPPVRPQDPGEEICTDGSVNVFLFLPTFSGPAGGRLGHAHAFERQPGSGQQKTSSCFRVSDPGE